MKYRCSIKHICPTCTKPMLYAVCFNFLCGGLKILTLKINTLQTKLQISEKYL